MYIYLQNDPTYIRCRKSGKNRAPVRTLATSFPMPLLPPVTRQCFPCMVIRPFVPRMDCTVYLSTKSTVPTPTSAVHAIVMDSSAPSIRWPKADMVWGGVFWRAGGRGGLATSVLGMTFSGTFHLQHTCTERVQPLFLMVPLRRIRGEISSSVLISPFSRSLQAWGRVEHIAQVLFCCPKILCVLVRWCLCCLT